VDAWATLEQVVTLTGITVDAPVLAQAQSHIEMACGRLFEDTAERMGTRDQTWLGRAVAYQAAWLTAQPDWATRLEITADGSSASATQYPPKALVLASNAKLALSRVSWLRSRSLRVLSADEANRDNTSEDEPEDTEPGWSQWKPVA
jgi:hypothetical protein